MFIDIYLDEDVDVVVADLLKARGFVAVTTRDAGNLGAEGHALRSSFTRPSRGMATPCHGDF
jgi:hypothetical protein